MKNILIITGFLFVFTACSTQQPLINISSVNQTEQLNLKNKQNILLDVRTPEEYEEAHIPGAINLNVLSDDFDTEIEKLDKNKNYYVYCRSGKRSTMAVEKMKASDFMYVVNLKDGFDAYQPKKKN